MDFYDILMAPLERYFLGGVRKEFIGRAKGQTLEVGVGTGVNLQYYNHSEVKKLTCLDIDYTHKLEQQYPNVDFIKGSVENIPFDNETFHSVISTLLLCTVDLDKSLKEILRVLKPQGLFIFIEHVRPVGKIAAKFTDVANHVWPKIASGCNLNRQTDKIITKYGFQNIIMKQKGVFRYGMAEKL